MHSLTTINGIGDAIAYCLEGVGIKTPVELQNASADEIVRKFAEKDHVDRRYWKVAKSEVKKWRPAAKSDEWKYCV